MEALRGLTSGLAIPYYVVDVPGGGGKIPLMPNYILSMGDERTVLRNYEGIIVSYEEVRDDGRPWRGSNRRCRRPATTSTAF